MRSIRFIACVSICIAVATGLMSFAIPALDWFTSNTAYAAPNDAGKGNNIVLVRGKIKPKKARQTGGQWRFKGDAEWLDHKDVYVVEEGEHTLEFRDIDGWIAPNDKVVQIEDTGVIVKLKGKYRRD